MSNKTVGAIVGAAMMVLTTLLFVLLGHGYYATAVYWIAFVAVLGMEFGGGMLLLFAKRHPHRVMAAVGVWMGSALMGGLSVVYIPLFSDGTAFFATFTVMVAAAAGLQALILWRHSGKSTRQEDAGAFFESCRNVVALLRSLPENKAHGEALRLLEDDLRYADDTRRTEQDGQIKELLTQLSNGLETPGYDPAEVISKLRSLLRQRQQMLHP